MKRVDVTLDKVLNLISPFRDSSKNPCKPQLAKALVKENAVYATDNRILAVIECQDANSEKMFNYTKGTFEDEVGFSPVEGILQKGYRICSKVDVNDWHVAHVIGAVAANRVSLRVKEHNKSSNQKDQIPIAPFIELDGSVLRVDGEMTPGDLRYCDFSYQLECDSGINVFYDCSNMLKALKLFKKLGINQVDLFKIDNGDNLIKLEGQGVTVVLVTVRDVKKRLTLGKV